MKIKTQKTKINQQIIIKNNKKTKTKKIKAMGNIAPSMDHYPRNGQMGHTDPYLICHVNPGSE